MGNSRPRANQNNRPRLGERGLTKFDVLGLKSDRELIRSLARRLAENGSEASRLRMAISRDITGKPPRKGGILRALRRSPLVGAELDLTRRREHGRKFEL